MSGGAWAVGLSALFTGLVAVAVTVAVERLGGRLGGLLGTLPTTIVPAALGIYAQSASTEAFQQAMGATPAGMLVDVMFLYLWRVLPPLLPAGGLWARLAMMVCAALLGWAAAAAGCVVLLERLRQAEVDLLLVGLLLSFLSVAAGAAACLRNPPAPAGQRAVGPLTLLARGTLAAAAIAAAVWLAGFGGPLLSGMAAVFPAIFLTTMVSLWISQGEAVQAGAVGPMMLGSTSVSTFALLAGVLFPRLGVGPGAVVAWLLATAAVTVPAWLWLRRLQQREP